MRNIFIRVFWEQTYLKGCSNASPDPIIACGNQDYEIKSIVLHKTTRGRSLYKVIWRRYNAIEATFLKEKDLANTSELLKAY